MPPDQHRVAELLAEALEGNATNINELRRSTQEQLHLARRALGSRVVLSRPSVLQVLRNWRDGALTDEQVRWWALLMSIGAFPEEWSPYGWRVHHTHQPIDVDFSHEVSEVIGRIRCVGDFDDGGRIRAEVDQMIRQMSDS